MQYSEIEELIHVLEQRINGILQICNECLNVSDEFKREKEAVAAILTLKNILLLEIESFIDSADFKLFIENKKK